MLGTCYLQSSVELLVVFSKLWLTRRDLLKVCFINYLFSSPGIIVRTGHWEKIKFSLYFWLGIFYCIQRRGIMGPSYNGFLKMFHCVASSGSALVTSLGNSNLFSWFVFLFVLFCFCFVCVCLFVCFFWFFLFYFTLFCFILFFVCLFRKWVSCISV